MMGSLRILLLMAAALLAGCGFQPLYGETASHGPRANELANIEVAPIADRLGQQVRNRLEETLTPLGPPGAALYRLEVTLTKTVQGFGFRRDESVTRENLRLEAAYRLIRLGTTKPVLEGTARSNVAYDVVRSDFANLSAREDAEERTAEQLVAILANRLSLHFLKTRSGQGRD